MSKTIRFGVSIEETLLETFDQMIEMKGYQNRSEAIRDMLRAQLVKEKIASGRGAAFGILSFIYDHHKREIEEKLNSIQHDFFRHIVSATHVHIDHDHCLEMIILKGPAKSLKKFTDYLLSIKGVKHGNLTLTLPVREM